MISEKNKFWFCVASWYFVSGCEMSAYQPILPGEFNRFKKDINRYLDYTEHLGLSQGWIGILIASYGFAAMCISGSWL